MSFKFPAKTFALLLAAGALVAIGIAPATADPQPRYYRSNGPNVVYRQGPHTRIYVTKRSWLDAGTEVLPGQRKFTDYAFPQGPSFATQNNNRPLERAPLSTNSDLGGGGPTQFPLY